MEWFLRIIKEYTEILGPQMAFISSVLGTLIAIVSGVLFIVGSVKRILGRRIRISGIYATIATEFKTNQRFIHDIMKISRSIFGYKGRTIHLIDKKRNQMIRFSIERGTEVYKGDWKNMDDGTRGFLKLSYDKDENILHGIWIGEDSKTFVNGGEWIFMKLSDYRNSKELFEFLKSDETSNPIADPNRLQTIIQRHREFKDDHFDYNGLRFNVSRDTFIPTLGKVSIPLIEQANSILGGRPPSSVLDIGCGIGFYALIFKRMGAKTVIGIDTSPTAIDMATQNAHINKMEINGELKFLRSNRMFDDLNPRTDKFDLIIANLPFTASDSNVASDPTSYDAMFCSDKQTLQDFIFGCQQFVSDNGMILFTFGSSGYTDYLNKLLGLTVFNKQLLMTFQGKDETFFVYKLSLNERFNRYRFKK